MNRSTISVGLAVAECTAVILAIGSFVSSRVFQPYMLIGVALLAGSFLVRWATTGQAARRTPLDIPLLLFVVSAAIGVWAAYDRSAAAVKFMLIVSGVTLYYLLASRATETWFAVSVAMVLSLCGMVLAVYSTTQSDYSGQTGKFAIITQIGKWITAVTPRLPGHRPHPNIVAATLEIILPISLAAALGIQGKWLKLAFAVASSVIAVGLFMTASRGAWLALGLVGAAAASFAWLRRHVPGRWQAALVLASLAAIALLTVTLLRAYPGDVVTQLLGSIPGGDRAISRGELYGQALMLVRDYPFTGSGLGMFPMVFSTYVLLIWVPFLSHAHNLFLQVWIEQGALGFAAFVWLVVAFYLWAWQSRKRFSWLAAGGVAATSIMLLHGLLDTGLYAARALPLMFVPMGLAGSQMAPLGSQRAEVSTQREDGRGLATVGWGQGVMILVLLCVAVAAAMAVSTDVAAVWYANLGAVAQTRAELENYRFPDRLVDDVRYEGELAVAEGYLQKALSFDPANLTARQRLALIALGRGQHEVALRYLSPVLVRYPEDVITRQLFGETLLGLGRLDEAYSLCSTFPDAVTRLNGIAWVRYSRHNDRQRAAWAQSVAERVRTLR